MNVLQKIFRDNYEIIQYTFHPRDVVMESIDKMINCGNPSFGGAMYCNDRATAMSFKLIKLILSILVDTFISKISFPMQPGPEIGSISDA